MKATTITRALIALGTALVLGVVNLGIAGKERIRRDGELVYLRLAPVDPRSLVQGDYMALRFALAQEIERGLDDAAADGEVRWAAVTLDERRVASLATASAPAGARLRYRIRQHRVWLGTNAYFFEEGRAERYAGARYGEFRVDRASGEAVLVGLRNDALEAL